MGNLIACTVSIFVPLLNHLYTVPFLYAPERWGGIPWKPPGGLKLALITFLINLICIWILGAVSSVMATKAECNKADYWDAFKRALWLVLGWVLGNILLRFIPFLKAPLLIVLMWIPYAAWIVHGILVAGVMLIMGAIGNTVAIENVCNNIG